MSTIITQSKSLEGGGSRRCDATCHKAKHKDCACVCGGRYHGAGDSNIAREQLTRDMLGEEWVGVKAAALARGIEVVATVQAPLYVNTTDQA